jgi:hypothetical protein
MAKQLDRSKAYGVICGTGESDGRMPHYEQVQGGRSVLFDARGREIVAGEPEPLKQKSAARKPELLSPLGKPTPADADAIRSPTELLERSDELPLSVLRRRAAVILADLGEAPLPANAGREFIEDTVADLLNAHSRGLYR